jgi:hypothetical protein
MTHFDEGSAYSYLPLDGEEPAALDVGWLGAAHRFATGIAPPELLEKIAWLCVHAPTCQTRGIHRCDLCASDAFHYVELVGRRFLLGFGRKKIRLGSAEIRVRGADGLYAAPDLILHYIMDHSYLPPGDFIAGALTSKERLPFRIKKVRT